MLFPILRPSSLPIVVAQHGERHANGTAFVLVWYDRHRAYNMWFLTYWLNIVIACIVTSYQYVKNRNKSKKNCLIKK